MANTDQAAWVVLVDKNPLGPFNEDEIRNQLGKGELRPNDIAFKVQPGTSTPTSEWKFLWQFGEFERRNQTDLPAEPSLAFESERRNNRSPAQLRSELIAGLPSEFEQLPTLVAQALPNEPRGLASAKAEAGIEREDYSVNRPSPAGNQSWPRHVVYAAIGISASWLVWKAIALFERRGEAERQVASEAPAGKASPRKPKRK